ncbi:hypothetical protein [Streptomyces specialis]|uniref:hypothetical protein n=1 Tax=Streptomyces specialis TaxID=498367 RepID=UPI00131AA3E3|nr:hypothetical protein [Streptomyces specialis]
MGVLDRASGAAIADPQVDFVAWLVEPGSAVGWDLPGVAAFGRGHVLFVPPTTPPDTAMSRWAIEPDRDFLTCPKALYGALVRVTGGRVDPRVLSSYTSPECLTNGHEACTKGEVRPTPPGSGVVVEPCVCGCHWAENGR